MPKIVINNFGPVKHAEIDIRRMLVLIGEQASGKSTIAKLIYFFQSVPSILLLHQMQHVVTGLDIQKDIISPVREQFISFFGVAVSKRGMKITYTYDNGKDLTIYAGVLNTLTVKFNVDFFDEDFIDKLNTAYSQFGEWKQKRSETKDEMGGLLRDFNVLMLQYRLSRTINEYFNVPPANRLYVIAGRSTTVAYTDLFEKQIFSDAQKKIVEGEGQQSRLMAIDDSLLLQYMTRVSRLKQVFEKYGSFSQIINSIDDREQKNQLEIVNDLVEKILKGKYLRTDIGETIFYDEREGYVMLRNASSGQQEVIRILQDVFVALFEKQVVSRIIEEPEVHLFPLGQKYICELLALLLNANENNTIVITTHSPYILSALNNLLFASKVLNDNNKNVVGGIIDGSSVIKRTDFSAYTLSISDGNTCKSIINEETGIIDQNYLDTVSDVLAMEFAQLFKIYRENGAN